MITCIITKFDKVTGYPLSAKEKHYNSTKHLENLLNSRFTREEKKSILDMLAYYGRCVTKKNNCEFDLKEE